MAQAARTLERPVYTIIAMVLLFVIAVAAYQFVLVPRILTSPDIQGPTCGTLSESAFAANNQTIAEGTKAAYYDTQLWMGFTKNSTSLNANVTAVAQSDSYGFGPAYLLNGLTDGQLWYQVGIAWNWPTSQSAEASAGFFAIVEVWNSTTGSPTVPSLAQQLDQPVNPGDSIGLSLSVSKGSVTMSTTDWRNNGSWSIVLADHKSSRFVGTDYGSQYPTSLLTEWYHVLPFYCSNAQVLYSFPSNGRNAWMAIDELNLTGVPYSEWSNSTYVKSVFSSTTPFITLIPAPSRSLETNGIIIYSNETNFLTM